MFTITGRDSSGKIVASDKTELPWKADQIAHQWRGSGLTVEVEQPPAVVRAYDRASGAILVR